MIAGALRYNMAGDALIARMPVFFACLHRRGLSVKRGRYAPDLVNYHPEAVFR
jgi:hypothetical protein